MFLDFGDGAGEHFIGLRRGETSILLRADNGSYWEPEKIELPQPPISYAMFLRSDQNLLSF